MRKHLQNHLAATEKGKIYNSYDVIGKIAVIKVPNNDLENAKKAAQAILSIYKNMRSVFVQTSPIVGSLRVRKLMCVAGENNPTTLHKESGCIFKVDVANCYFSPRLSHERSRVAGSVKRGETVVNMFAGVGCFSILIARQVPDAKVYSIDINPSAFNCMEENIKLNQVDSQVFPLLGNSKTIIAQLQGLADRVLMPLPEKALEYLPYALTALKPCGGVIHYYDFEHATKNEQPLKKTKSKVAATLEKLGVNHDFSFSRIVRSIGPNWYQTVLDIRVKSRRANFNN